MNRARVPTTNRKVVIFCAPLSTGGARRRGRQGSLVFKTCHGVYANSPTHFRGVGAIRLIVQLVALAKGRMRPIGDKRIFIIKSLLPTDGESYPRYRAGLGLMHLSGC